MDEKLRRFAGRILPIAVVAATFALFAVIAILQSRWIGQLSESELQRDRIRLQLAVRAIQTDINRELSRAYAIFQWEAGVSPDRFGAMTSEAYAIWRQNAAFPDLIRRVLIAQQPPDSGALEIRMFDSTNREYFPMTWPPELDELRARLTLPFKDFDTFGARTFTGIAMSGVPVIVLPLSDQFSGGMPAKYPDANGWLLLELDQDLLLTRIIPESMRANLDQPDQFDYQITRDGFPERVIYRSNPGSALSRADGGCTLLELRREYLRTRSPGTGLAVQFPIGQSADEQQLIDRFHRWQNLPVTLSGVPPSAPNEGGVWQLDVRHRAGSLEAAVGRMRRGNLLLAFVTIALIGVNLAILGLSARRAHRLAEARLRFAAGVSHELRTPLAAICSAADNLAAGVACEPHKVRQYGAAILSQGKQLAEMVEQILAFSAVQRARKYDQARQFDIAQILREAVAAVGTEASAAGITIEARIPEDLPAVTGDGNAIRQAVINLLHNAIRYAAAGRWIGLSARHAADGEIEISIADNGLGIPAEELKCIFEPFYRGSAAMSIPGRRGGGLGLAIVEQTARAHGGRVSVTSEPFCGTCFTLHLPAFSYATTNSRSGR